MIKGIVESAETQDKPKSEHCSKLTGKSLLAEIATRSNNFKIDDLGMSFKRTVVGHSSI